MKTFKPLFMKCLLLSGLLLSADAAMAGRWDDHRGWRGQDRHYDRHYDRHHGRGYDRGNVQWSVNLNLGAPGYWGYQPAPRWRSSRGWRTFYQPAPVIIQPRPVIIQNTYVAPSNGYVAPNTGYAAPSAGQSLFRDRYGRCYERSYNTLGTEIRTELPASACNF